MQKFHKQREAPLIAAGEIHRENRVHRILVRVLLLVMVVEWTVLLIDKSWLSAFLVTLIIATLLSPVIFRKKLDMEIPAEFHITAVVFIFASLYLGEIQDFYHRFWWWDIALHTSAGLLMGIVGFLLVYLLNESQRIDLHMTPFFISLFTFSFAVTIGTLWEIFEYTIDYLERNFGFDFAPEIVNAESPSNLMLLAAGGELLLRRQACTALKVMHVLHQVDARELKSRLNISDRALYHMVEEKTTHAIRDMKAQGFPIIDFQSSRKTNDSIITKLLSKRQGSRELLYDRIRFRIVTATIDEIVPVVAYLGRHLFPFHFTVPGESHNSIFNFKDFIRRHPRISKMIPELQVDLMHEDEMIEPSNPDTSRKFKTVSFIVELPIRLDERHLEVWAPGIKLPSRVVHVLSEFQIVDQDSNIGNKNDDASHDRYKARRLAKVKERLLQEKMTWGGKDIM